MVETKVKLGTVFIMLFLLLMSGTMVFKALEGWSFIDSFYFTSTTLMTIGYGDLSPTTDTSKLVTVAFALAGVATFLYGLGVISSYYIQKGQQFEQYEAEKIKEIVGNIKIPFKKKKGLPR